MDINEKPKCFVIMPISDPEGYEKGHFEKIYRQIFVPAIERAGYKAHRADDNKSCHYIQENILRDLIDAPLALCDLSSRNPNVLYELGIRHAFDKPVVLVQETNTPRIFDISPINTIEYRPIRKYDEVIEDQEIIFNSINATITSEFNVNSLIKYLSLSAATLSEKMSDEEEDKYMLKSIFVELQDIRSKVNTSDKTSRNVLSKNFNIKSLDNENSYYEINKYLKSVDNYINNMYDMNQMNIILDNIYKIQALIKKDEKLCNTIEYSQILKQIEFIEHFLMKNIIK